MTQAATATAYMEDCPEEIRVELDRLLSQIEQKLGQMQERDAERERVRSGNKARIEQLQRMMHDYFPGSRR